MQLVEREWRENGTNLTREIGAQVLAHRGCPRILVEKRNLFVLEKLAQLGLTLGMEFESGMVEPNAAETGLTSLR